MDFRTSRICALDVDHRTSFGSLCVGTGMDIGLSAMSMGYGDCMRTVSLGPVVGSIGAAFE